MLGAVGVLVNGVALNGVATKLSEALPVGQELQGEDRWVDAVKAEGWMDDGCFGHLSGGGNYHMHGWAEPLDRKACGLPEDVSVNIPSSLAGRSMGMGCMDQMMRVVLLYSPEILTNVEAMTNQEGATTITW
jgi:hypothetical protein